MPAANSRTVHYKNDLRRLTLLIGGALAFFGVLLVAVVAFAGWSANRAAVVRERQLVENALDQGVSRVLNEQKSIAWWDDAVLNISAGPFNTEWVEVNFGIWLNETYGHDEIYILDARNHPIYANVNGEMTDPAPAYAAHREVLDQIVAEARNGADGRLRARDSAFITSQENYNELLGARYAHWAGHIMRVDGHPAVVTAIGIVPNLDASLVDGPPHLQVSVVRIDEDFMADLGRSLLMPDLTISEDLARGDGVMSENFFADDGAGVGYLSWTTKRPGQSLLVFILPLVVMGVVGAGVITAVMITRLKRASVELADREELAHYEAKHDPLSSLPNRQHFVERLQENLDALVQQRNGARVVVAYIDVDRFKDVNDTLGHEAGDVLIKAVAARLLEFITPGDFIARFGGDEFAVMRTFTRAEEAAELADRLRLAFEENFDVNGQDVRMTASIGISVAPDHGVSPEELMRHADIALYQGKNQGRDRAMFFCSEMAAEVEQRRAIELELRTAIEGNHLTLHYQPLISCGSERVSGLEALLRWRHPTKGDIPPGVFVPIAEEAGLMPALGAWVLERAFTDAKRWPDLDIAINLSPVQFRHVDLVGLLERLIVTHDVNPHRIVLEVTEGVLLDSTDRNRATLDSFRNLGFKVALDDFGTGYSSLRYLCDFRFDKIKIDRAFVTGVNERRRAMTIIQSVVTIGRGLGMDIVAEGVETEAEASAMRLLGVSELQGFYFSRPVAPEAVDAIIAGFSGPADMQDSARADAERTALGS